MTDYSFPNWIAQCYVRNLRLKNYRLICLCIEYLFKCFANYDFPSGKWQKFKFNCATVSSQRCAPQHESVAMLVCIYFCLKSHHLTYTTFLPLTKTSHFSLRCVTSKVCPNKRWKTFPTKAREFKGSVNVCFLTATYLEYLNEPIKLQYSRVIISRLSKRETGVSKLTYIGAKQPRSWLLVRNLPGKGHNQLRQYVF